MSSFLYALVGKLPVGVQPYAKMLVPVVVAAVAVVVQLVETNEFNTEELWTAVSGAVLAILVYAVPNRGYEPVPEEVE